MPLRWSDHRIGDDQVNFINNAVSAGDKGIHLERRCRDHQPRAGSRRETWCEGRHLDSDALKSGRTIYVEGTSTASIARPS